MRKAKEVPKKHAGYRLGKPRRAADCLPQGGTPPPARFFIMALRGNVFFGVSRSMRSWPQGYVQRGIERERERERDTYVGAILVCGLMFEIYIYAQ